MAEGDDQDDSQRTEDPTPKKLEEARKRGQVARSMEVNNWVMLLVGTIVIGALSPALMNGMTGHLRAYIEHAHDFPQVPGGFRIILGDSFFDILRMLALPLLVLMAAAFAASFLQVGALFAPDIIKPDLGKISPVKGFQRLFSLRSLVEFAKGLMKLALIGCIGTLILLPFYDRIDHFVGLPVSQMMDEMLALILRLMIGVLVALALVAGIDVLYQRTDYSRKMRMTRQEMVDEYKQTEGDPHIKAKLRQLRQQKARQRMMANVPKATVVITNPTHFAVALRYEPDDMEAPLCVAKGADNIALKIREVARENNVTIYENPPLARVLYDTVEIDETIPPEHYKAVAEVISFVFRQSGRIK